MLSLRPHPAVYLTSERTTMQLAYIAIYLIVCLAVRSCSRGCGFWYDGIILEGRALTAEAPRCCLVGPIYGQQEQPELTIRA